MKSAAGLFTVLLSGCLLFTACGGGNGSGTDAAAGAGDKAALVGNLPCAFPLSVGGRFA